MDSPQVITWMIAGCIMFIAFLFFQKVFKKVFKILIRGVIWGVGFLICNTVLSMAGIGVVVGLNLVTFLIVAFLGFPGFVLLYATQVVLG